MYLQDLQKKLKIRSKISRRTRKDQNNNKEDRYKKNKNKTSETEWFYRKKINKIG